MKILHFADAHIDMANYGRHDAKSGLPQRTLDFLKALDTIIDTAVSEKVDLVLFAGDAYKDRTPVPTFQREWGQRMMRLSKAGITTLLLVGNHDVSPAVGRAHALQEYDTLQIPHIFVANRPFFFTSDLLDELPLQIMALPWIFRSGLVASQELSTAQPSEVFEKIEDNLSQLVQNWFIEKVDPSLPVILTAHASVQGAVYGGERSVMLGNDLVLPPSLVKDPRFNYVALGHIHKMQNLNEGCQPPVIYPGSIERVDFGEIRDDKCFVIAQVEQGKDTLVEWRKLPGRKFISRSVQLVSRDDIQVKLISALPAQEEIADAIVRLIIDYPRDWESEIDEIALRRYAEGAFEFHLMRRPQVESRSRIPTDEALSTYAPLDLLDLYWKTLNTTADEVLELQQLASSLVTVGSIESGTE